MQLLHLSLHEAVSLFETKPRDRIKVIQDCIGERLEIPEPYGLTPVSDFELRRIGLGGRGVEPTEGHDEGGEVSTVKDYDTIGAIDEAPDEVITGSRPSKHCRELTRGQKAPALWTTDHVFKEGLQHVETYSVDRY